MHIGELFADICAIPEELRDIAVTGVTSDSREVESGFVFVCIKGAGLDGHSQASEAVGKSAVAVTGARLGLEREITVS